MELIPPPIHSVLQQLWPYLMPHTLYALFTSVAPSLTLVPLLAMPFDSLPSLLSDSSYLFFLGRPFQVPWLCATMALHPSPFATLSTLAIIFSLPVFPEFQSRRDHSVFFVHFHIPGTTSPSAWHMMGAHPRRLRLRQSHLFQ